MKTAKQIYFRMEEKGKELFAQIKSLDKIIVTEDTLRKIFKGQEAKKVNTSPILQKGVSIQQADDMEDYMIFNVTARDEDSYTFHCESFQIYYGRGDSVPDGTPLWEYSADIKITYGEDVKIEIANFDDAFVSIYRKQKLPDKADKHMDKTVDDSTQNIVGFLRVMAYINYLSEHPEFKTIEKNEEADKNVQMSLVPDKKPSDSDSHSSFPARKKKSEEKNKVPLKNPVHSITINGIRVISADEKLNKKLSSKKRQRLTESWNVRGHYRHYKSGKTVYVNPYTKGSKEGKPVPREYKIKV